VQTRACSGGACRPQDCVGAWGEWSSCNADCKQSSLYSVSQPAANGGTACSIADGAVQSRACSGGACRPQDCVGAWGEWSSCNADCKQSSLYSVSQPAANGGAACSIADGAVQSRACSGGACVPRDCLGAWGEWSSCSMACQQSSTYSITQVAAHGGSACSNVDGAVRTQLCSGGACVPQDCLGAWGQWSSCSATCTQTATYLVSQPAANGGSACAMTDGAVRTQPCSGGSCKPVPQDCLGAWGEWSSCSATCTQTATYTVMQPAVHGGVACQASGGEVQTQPCSGGACSPVHCVGTWSEWSICSAGCDQTTTYSITQPASNGGSTCPNAEGEVQTRACSGGSCSSSAGDPDCEGSWGAWSSCSSACTETATYSIRKAPAPGGAACPVADGAVQTRPCSGGSCSLSAVAVDCAGGWGEWSSCSSACTQSATYSIGQPAANGGVSCPVADGAARSRPCSGGACKAVDCVGQWGEWGSCSTACTHASTYTILQPAANGGAACGFESGTVRSQPCTGGECRPLLHDCVGSWGTWSSCSAACTQTATYTITQLAANGGAACGFESGTVRSQPCTGGECRPLLHDCVGSWGAWSSCSAACTQTSIYDVIQPAANGGAACTSVQGTVQSRSCTGDSCIKPVVAVDCVGVWSDWSSCDASCFQTSMYKVTQPAANGGRACPVEEGAVNTHRCSSVACTAVECLGSWGEWSSCSAACMQTGEYRVTRPAANDGAACPHLEGAVRSQPCRGDSCSATDPPANSAVECYGAWGAWSSCSPSCLRMSVYSADVRQSRAASSSACPYQDGAVKRQPCRGDSCPVADGAIACVGSWSKWSTCSTLCTQTRVYNVEQAAAGGGAYCPVADGTLQTRSCTGGSCTADAGNATMLIIAVQVTLAVPANVTTSFQRCKAIVTLRTASGQPLYRARVFGIWSAPITETHGELELGSEAAEVQETRMSGQAVFRSCAWRKDSAGTVCRFTVTDVKFPGKRFDRPASVTVGIYEWR
jgi:hypothetical protein